MRRSQIKPAFYLILVTAFLSAHCSATIISTASTFKSLAELNAAVVSVPLLLVLFEPFTTRDRGEITPDSDIQCSTKCKDLLALCNGAAALPLPKSSRITCGHAQGDKEWMKMYVFSQCHPTLQEFANACSCH
jgi:hypothetical protein